MILGYSGQLGMPKPCKPWRVCSGESPACSILALSHCPTVTISNQTLANTAAARPSHCLSADKRLTSICKIPRPILFNPQSLADIFLQTVDRGAVHRRRIESLPLISQYLWVRVYSSMLSFEHRVGIHFIPWLFHRYHLLIIGWVLKMRTVDWMQQCSATAQV